MICPVQNRTMLWILGERQKHAQVCRVYCGLLTAHRHLGQHREAAQPKLSDDDRYC